LCNVFIDNHHLETLARNVAARLGETAFCVVFEAVTCQVKGAIEPNGRKKFILLQNLRVGLP
jgi:hypothetical protein